MGLIEQRENNVLQLKRMYLCDLRVFEGGLLIKGCVWDKWVEEHVWRNFV